MGHNTSKTAQEAKQYGDIYFKLDKTVMTPGETITGTVFLNLLASYPASKLCFKLKGAEFAKRTFMMSHNVRKKHGPDTKTHEKVRREGSHEIIRQESIINDWGTGSVIAPGQYSFPVSFMVPNGLPGSFFYHAEWTVAEIAYKIQAYLKPDTPDFPIMKDTKSVTIRESIDQTFQTQARIKQAITGCCCCVNKGYTDLTSTLQKTAFTPGEDAKVVNDVQNWECAADINDVTVELVQNLVLTINSQRSVINNVVRNYKLGSMRARDICMRDTAKIAHIMLPVGQEGTSKGQHGEFDAEGPKNIDIHEVMSPSTHGTLITSEYVVNVVCDMDVCDCCGSNPKVSLPIQVLAVGNSQPADPEPPVDWRPEEAPMISLAVHNKNVNSVLDKFKSPLTNLAAKYHVKDDYEGGQEPVIKHGGTMEYSNTDYNAI